MDRSSPRYLIIGRVIKPHGLRGEVAVEIMTDFPDRFALLDTVYLGEEKTPFALKRFRLYKGRALLKLAGCDTREAAEDLRGQLVQIPIEQAMPLGEDEYYIHQVIGLEAWTTKGEFLGRVSEVLSTPANDVFVVQDEKSSREILIPAIEDVVVKVDLKERKLVIEPMEGLI